MDKEIISKKVNELAEEYEFSKSTIQKYCHTLYLYPFVLDDEPEKLLECLEMIVQDRVSHKIIDDGSLRRTVNETICDCVYRVYGDKSIHFLNESFLKQHEIEETVFDEAVVYEKGYSVNELRYHGYR